MRLCRARRLEGLLIASLLFTPNSPAWNGTQSSTLTTDALSQTQLDRARSEVERIRGLVDQGALARTYLEQAEERLADAEDQMTLAETLYGVTHLENMAPEAAERMVKAAKRRVERQQKIVDDRQIMLGSGVISNSEYQRFQDELTSRRRVLELADNRKALLESLRAMAEHEKQLEQALQKNTVGTKDVMIRYGGNGQFSLGDMSSISAEFERHFHQVLPISALGQTMLHQSMQLDHRNRVDVALNPDAPQGLWLRQLLERLHIPYLAFRSAVAGAATAPHIHIGLGSTRLKLAPR